jgi:hypothetical protein
MENTNIINDSKRILDNATTIESTKALLNTFIGAHELVDTIFMKGRYFIDLHGRVLLLRGVNLCGSSKLPTVPVGVSSSQHAEFYDHRAVSFIGRPFALDEASQHFQRLRSWGLTFVRLLVPWEALEHSGPGIYGIPF